MAATAGERRGGRGGGGRVRTPHTPARHQNTVVPDADSRILRTLFSGTSLADSMAGTDASSAAGGTNTVVLVDLFAAAIVAVVSNAKQLDAAANVDADHIAVLQIDIKRDGLLFFSISHFSVFFLP